MHNHVTFKPSTICSTFRKKVCFSTFCSLPLSFFNARQKKKIAESRWLAQNERRISQPFHLTLYFFSRFVEENNSFARLTRGGGQREEVAKRNQSTHRGPINLRKVMGKGDTCPRTQKKREAKMMQARVRKRQKSATASSSRQSSPVLASVFIVISFSLSVVDATRHHYIHWNSSNPIFRIDNTDHIIDVNVDNLPHEVDQANIICPKYGRPSSGDDMEKYVIYSVSKEEYDTCRIMSRNPKVAFVCDRPHDLHYFTITFRSFSPTPGGMEFKPGRDYYFISTSSGDDLWRKSGGRCSTHNMRLVFKVADNRNRQQQQQDGDGHESESDPAHGDYYYPAQVEEEEGDEEELGGNGVEEGGGGGGGSPYPGRRGERDYGNNGRGGGLIKQEASRMQHSSSSSSLPTSSSPTPPRQTRGLLLLLVLLLSVLPLLWRQSRTL